jgi:hypothetical protein
VLSSTLVFCGLGASLQGSFLPLNEGVRAQAYWQSSLFGLSLLASLWLVRVFSVKAMQKLKAREAPRPASGL